MDTALQYDRLQFAVTATFHYLFPQLTMGLALLLVYLRTRDLLSEGDHYHQVARFWTGIFALSFAFGVVTGIPLEFQFGTNWAKFSEYAGGIVGQTLAMEGVFAFFGVVVPRGALIRRIAREPAHVVAGDGFAMARFLVIRLFYSGDERLDATSCGLSRGGRRPSDGRESGRAAHESLADLAVRP